MTREKTFIFFFKGIFISMPLMDYTQRKDRNKKNKIQIFSDEALNVKYLIYLINKFQTNEILLILLI